MYVCNKVIQPHLNRIAALLYEIRMMFRQLSHHTCWDTCWNMCQGRLTRHR